MTIELDNGNTIVGKNIQFSSDSTSWTELESENYYNVQSANIQEIRVINRSRSGKTGLFTGMLLGGVIGANEVSSEGYEWLDGVEKAFHIIFSSDEESKTVRYASGIIIGGMIGGLFGYTVGAIVGSTDRYIFDQDTQRVKIEDNSLIRIEFTSIIAKGSGYLIIQWQGKEIPLERSEYNYRGTKKSGQQFIVVPKEIYESKFK